MKETFDRSRKLILIDAGIEGPYGTGVPTVAIDTGAVRTVLSPEFLMLLGYDLASTRDRVELITGSGLVVARSIRVRSIRAVGKTKIALNVIVHSLPPRTGIDGLLGLDFFLDTRLGIDFRQGTIELN